MAKLTPNVLSFLFLSICCLLSGQCYADEWDDIYGNIFSDRAKLEPSNVLSELERLLEIYPKNQDRIEEGVREEIQQLVEAGEWNGSSESACKTNLPCQLARELSIQFKNNVREYLLTHGRLHTKFCLAYYERQLEPFQDMNRRILNDLVTFKNVVFAADETHINFAYRYNLYQDDPPANSVVKGLLAAYESHVGPLNDISEIEVSEFKQLMNHIVSIPCGKPNADVYPVVGDLLYFVKYVDRREVLEQLGNSAQDIIAITMACHSYLEKESDYIKLAMKRIKSMYPQSEEKSFFNKVAEKVTCGKSSNRK